MKDWIRNAEQYDDLTFITHCSVYDATDQRLANGKCLPGGQMATGTKKSVLTFVSGLILILNVVPVSASPIVLLRENFNDVTGLNLASDTRTIADILASDPSQLPVGTTFVGSANVRRADNEINTDGGNNGFYNIFNSSFLVLGDDFGQIGGNPNGPNEDSVVRFPFEIPVGATSVEIRYRAAFNGVSTAFNRFDQFVVRLNGPGDTVDIDTFVSPIDFGFGTLFSFFDVLVDLDPGTISPGSYQLVFRLNESGNGDGQTNTAVGVDRVRVRAEVPVPEPETVSLLAGGLIGLAILRRRQGMWPPILSGRRAPPGQDAEGPFIR
jgi:hypothetical protein